VRAVLATMRAAMAEAVANRTAFWSQVGAMVVNDVVWVAFWVLFFDRVGHLGDWDRAGVLMLMAVLTTAGGLVLGVLSNGRRLGYLIADGGLEAVLALPVRPLPVLLVRQVDATNVGDVMFGICLFVAAGHPTPARLATFVLATGLGAVVLASFLVAAGSLSFFMRGNDVGDFAFNAMLMLAAYPTNVFGGLAKVLVFTAVPAVFVATVPARLVLDPNPGDLALLLAAAIVFAGVAWTTFTLGLRRYAGSSLWTRA
jgi:ABC-2 type transport system permease protein